MAIRTIQGCRPILSIWTRYALGHLCNHPRFGSWRWVYSIKIHATELVKIWLTLHIMEKTTYDGFYRKKMPKMWATA
jgi:hypothetical protein